MNAIMAHYSKRHSRAAKFSMSDQWSLITYCQVSSHLKKGKSLGILLFGDFIIIIIIKRDWQCKAGTERSTPYQSEDPSPTTPTLERKKRKGKQ